MRARKALNWIVVIAGTLLGVVGLANFGDQNPGYATIDRWWLSYIVAAALFAVVPLLGSAFAALGKRALAGFLFLLVIPLFARWAFLNIEFDPYFSHQDAWFAVICLVLGSYWLLVWWRNWPSLFSRLLSTRRKVVICVAALFALVVLDLAATLALVTRPYSSSVDCNVPAVFSQSTFGHDGVFTAHVIRVGHQVRISNLWLGSWAVAKVEERFWSWPLPRIVLLIAPEQGLLSGSDYLVDGRRLTGGLTRFLPIVEIRRCSRTQRLQDATLNLRVLRSGFPVKDVRIVGRVDRWVGRLSQQTFGPTKIISVAGAQVEITGPQGIISTTTDRDGIYDVAGLPPGKYQVRLPVGPGQESPVSLANFPSDLQAGEVAEYSFSFRLAVIRGN